MTILLSDIWFLPRLEEYKLHFARWDKVSQPLDVWVRATAGKLQLPAVQGSVSEHPNRTSCIRWFSISKYVEDFLHSIQGEIGAINA